MNEKLLELLKLIKIYNFQGVLENEFNVFADKSDYNIETIEDLVNTMKVEMSYWEP